MMDTNGDLTYEQFINAWVANGQYLRSERLTTEHIEKRNDLQLIGAQIIFRHGARTPLFLLPNLEEVVYSKDQIESYPAAKWDVKLITKKNYQVVPKDQVLSVLDVSGNSTKILKSASSETVLTGQLTSIGEKQLFELGKLIRSKLNDEINNNGFLPKTYNPQYIYCRSTYMGRTIASARSFLAGFYTSLESDNKIKATGPFEIEVHHFPDEDMFPNPNVAPILKQCHSVESLYASLTDEHDLKIAREAFMKLIGITETPLGILELYDDIVSRGAHNFTVPKDILALTKNFPVMVAREYIYRSTNIGLDAFIRASCGSFLYLMRENFNSIHKNFLEEKQNNSKKTYQKFFIYSGHDSSLISLGMAFEIFDLRWPNYGAYILLKYYASINDPNKTYVTVTYEGQPQILPNCQDYYCSYATFLNNLQNRFDQPKLHSET